VDAHFAANATLQVDLAPTLKVVELVVLLPLLDAIDRAYLQARLAAGAIVGIDDRELFGDLLAWALLGHQRDILKRENELKRPLEYFRLRLAARITLRRRMLNFSVSQAPKPVKASGRRLEA
jgi:hypothetical protein